MYGENLRRRSFNLQATLVDFVENTDRTVFSKGDATKDTILAAIEVLRKEDPFFTPFTERICMQ